MRPSVYLETTIASYLTARPSRDLVYAATQQITREWWERRRAEFDLFISQAVLDESAGGDPEAANRRLAALNGIAVLSLTPESVELARALSDRMQLPKRAAADALHIAIATVHKIQYLVTWNCTHLANAVLRPVIESVSVEYGYVPSVICTPQELLEDWSDAD